MKSLRIRMIKEQESHITINTNIYFSSLKQHQQYKSVSWLLQATPQLLVAWSHDLIPSVSITIVLDVYWLPKSTDS